MKVPGLAILLILACAPAFGLFIDLDCAPGIWNQTRLGLAGEVYPAEVLIAKHDLFEYESVMLGARYELYYDGELHHLVSLFPSYLYFALLAGWQVKLEPFFNFSKLNFDRVRLEGDIWMVFGRLGIYYELGFNPTLEHNIGVTLGVGAPVTLVYLLE